MYILQNRYQDSGWEELDVEFSEAQKQEALNKAQEFSKNPIYYGMVRVICSNTNSVIGTFSGGKKCDSRQDTGFLSDLPFGIPTAKKKKQVTKTVIEDVIEHSHEFSFNELKGIIRSAYKKIPDDVYLEAVFDQNEVVTGIIAKWNVSSFSS